LHSALPICEPQPVDQGRTASVRLGAGDVARIGLQDRSFGFGQCVSHRKQGRVLGRSRGAAQSQGCVSRLLSLFLNGHRTNLTLRFRPCSPRTGARESKKVLYADQSNKVRWAEERSHWYHARDEAEKVGG